MLQPFAPHLAEELFSRLEPNASLRLPYVPWPKFDPALLVEDTLEIPVQVNGKLRDKIVMPATATQAEIEAAALKAEKVQPFLAGKTVKKIIVVPKRLVNIVAVCRMRRTLPRAVPVSRLHLVVPAKILSKRKLSFRRARFVRPAFYFFDFHSSTALTV